MATKPVLSATAKRLAAAKRATLAESHSPSEMAALDLIAERNDLERAPQRVAPVFRLINGGDDTGLGLFVGHPDGAFFRQFGDAAQVNAVGVDFDAADVHDV